MINLELLLKQNLNINQELIQSLKILNMSKFELEEFLEKENKENVMLNLEYDYKNKDYKKIYKDKKNTNLNISNNFDFDRINEKKPSLEEYLNLQIIERNLSNKEEDIIRYLIYSLDDRGYLEIKLEEVAKILNYPLVLVENTQKLLTTFIPKGIGSINLKECLLAQIQTTNQNLKLLITNHLENLSLNKYEIIKKDLHISQKELTKLIEKLKTLNPNPLSFFDNERYEKLIIPEIFVSESMGELKIEIEKNNPININQYYLNLMDKNIDKKTKSYLKEKLSYLLLIKSSIDKRNQTLEEIANYLISYQEQFFLKNLPLNPINQDKLAKFLNISSSTVSRAIREKYIESFNGIFALKDLFSSPTKENTVSKDYILKMIQLIIKEEDKNNVLSDDQIMKKLTDMNIKIKRRTVQKYRNLLNIPSSYQRKRIYEFKNKETF